MTERRPSRSLASVVPGTRPNTPKRNIIVLLTYLLLLATAFSGMTAAADLLLAGAFAGTQTVI
ncbi:hypothetical protein HZS55_06335 [Halosimplex rubrum]|uniref:Uncharacterized protein n=1 Tax=Halosimplex rubrum TaxID=869889 RepID=A0A7D5TMY8_9EURY|nr:hypothetical protein [Halosimplex rubrum]QLH76934.1 hypothetical protein HZS55_06335 [Halosimplex rubrum]